MLDTGDGQFWRGVSRGVSVIAPSRPSDLVFCVERVGSNLQIKYINIHYSRHSEIEIWRSGDVRRVGLNRGCCIELLYHHIYTILMRKCVACVIIWSGEAAEAALSFSSPSSYCHHLPAKWPRLGPSCRSKLGISSQLRDDHQSWCNVWHHIPCLMNEMLYM